MGHGEGVLAMQRGSSPGQHNTRILASRDQVCLGAEGIIGIVICHRGAWLLQRVGPSHMTVSLAQICIEDVQQALGVAAEAPLLRNVFRVHALCAKQGTLPSDSYRKAPLPPASIYSFQEGGAQIEINLIFNVAVGGGGVLWLHPLLSELSLGICFPSMGLGFFICKLVTVFLRYLNPLGFYER